MERVHITAAALLGLAAAGLTACDDRADALTRSATADVAPPPPAAPPAEACLPSAPTPDALDVPRLVEQVRPAVVSVRGSRAIDPEERPDPLGPLDEGPPAGVERAVGSGVLITEDGLVLTNHHVVDGAFEVEVRLADNRAFEAEVIGRDPKLDVALLELRGADDLPAARLGSSEAVRVGDRAIVIGNPFGLGPTVTLGIVSATSREAGVGPFDAFIQTDAAINPGNSGGPVFNEAGEVIGLTAAIHAQGQGIGFAIPIDDVREVLPELRATGGVTRGRMGLAFQEVTVEIARALRLPAAAGALVTEVEPRGPAARAGIRPGDLILRLDAMDIGHARELARELGKRKPGEVISLRVRRGGAERTVSVKLERSEQDASPRAGLERPPPPVRGAPELSAIDAVDGARIEAIHPRSALAEELEVGDVVLELNGAAIRGAADLLERLRAAEPGADLLLRVRREGTTRYLVAKRSL